MLRDQQDAFNGGCVGRVLAVLFERAGRHPGQLVGRSPYMQAVHAAAPAAAIGDIVDLRIARAGANSLAGVAGPGVVGPGVVGPGVAEAPAGAARNIP